MVIPGSYCNVTCKPGCQGTEVKSAALAQSASERAAKGLCGQRSESLAALAQHGVARAQALETLGPSDQKTFGTPARQLSINCADLTSVQGALVNFLVRFASRHLFHWEVPPNCSENSLVRFFGFGVLLWL